jgi:hypothetical protein
MHILSWHGTVLIRDSTRPALKQRAVLGNLNADDALVVATFVDKTPRQNSWIATEFSDTKVALGDLSGDCLVSKRAGTRRVTIKKDGMFLSAKMPPNLEVSWDRQAVDVWETFLLITQEEIAALIWLLQNDWMLDDDIIVDRNHIALQSDFKIAIGSSSIRLDDFFDGGAAVPSTNAATLIIRGESNHNVNLARVDSDAHRGIAESLRSAVRQLSVGSIRESLETLDRCSKLYGTNDDVAYLRGRILPRLKARKEDDPATMFRIPPAWEKDWLNSILPALPLIEPGCAFDRLADRNIIVVDSHITPSKVAFYRRAYEVGCRVLLVHLSDEAFIDDHRAYRWCHAVYRNYYSPILREIQGISFFALGYKAGFATSAEPSTAMDRQYVWSFAGDPNKATRSQMLSAMRSIEGGSEHLTTGFNSPDALTVDKYRDMMDRSVFVPCPQGFTNLDSFRVYEALEAGCIPIVEKRVGFDYFGELYGRYPFPSLFSWDEAPSLINDIRQHRLEESIIAACLLWWRSYKSSLKERIASCLHS